MKYVRTTRTVNPETTVVFCQGEMDIRAVEELGIAPPAAPSSKPAPAPPASRSTPAREKAAPPRVEKIFPKPPPKRDAAFWRFWGGLAALLAASMALSIYLYLTRY